MEHFNKPVWNRSITALACSVLNRYGIKTENPSLKEADLLLKKKPRNLVLLLLDGLGLSILERHLPADSFLKSHCLQTLSSVFPPTTTAAATALESGLFPSQSGWLGWSVYWPELSDNINLYPNTRSDGTPAASVHLGKTALSFSSLREQIGAVSGVRSHALSCDAGTDIRLFLSQIGKLCKEEGPHFIYGYFNQPDNFLHKEGCDGTSVTAFMKEFDRCIGEFFFQWPDCMLLLTADHGFIDMEKRCLEDMPELLDALQLPPSVEPRALNCFIKEGKKSQFLDSFHRYMGDTYQIYSREEVCRRELFGPGPVHPRFYGMLGDYLAVAHTSLTLFPNRQYYDSMTAGHGGMTAEELTVPLIMAQTNIE